MTARRSRSTLAGTAIALAALLTVTSVTGASALWGAEATASLSVPGAQFGASSSSASLISSSYDGDDPYTGTVELLFPVSATSGSAPWTAAHVDVTGIGDVGDTGASVSVGGYAVTTTENCDAVTYAGGGSSAMLPGLVGLADGESRGVCVKLDIEGLSAASNNAEVRIEMVLAAAIGPSSVDGTGWTATAPASAIDVSMPSVPTGLPVLACSSNGIWVTATIDPARNGPVGLHLGSPEGEMLDYFATDSEVSEKSLWDDDMSHLASGRYTIYLVGEDGEGWGTFDVWYDSEDESLACAETD